MLRNFLARPQKGLGVVVTWPIPRFNPKLYTVDTECSYLQKSARSYKLDTVKARALTHRVIVRACPHCRCQVTLKAVYNQASLDQGISQTVVTAEEGELKHAVACVMSLYFCYI